MSWYSHHCILFLVSSVLLAGGVVIILIFGVANVRMYATSRRFRSATCDVIVVNYTGSRNCPPLDGATNVTSYPCVSIAVRYAIDSGETDGVVTNGSAILYETVGPEVAGANSVSRDNQTCSKHACSHATSAGNAADIRDFVSSWSRPAQRCYVDTTTADSSRRAYAYVVTASIVIHALLWPALMIGFGLFLFVVSLSLACFDASGSCRRRREERIARQSHFARADYILSVGASSGEAALTLAGTKAKGGERTATVSGSGCPTYDRSTTTTTSTSASSASAGSKASLLRFGGYGRRSRSRGIEEDGAEKQLRLEEMK